MGKFSPPLWALLLTFRLGFLVDLGSSPHHDWSCQFSLPCNSVQVLISNQLQTQKLTFKTGGCSASQLFSKRWLSKLVVGCLPGAKMPQRPIESIFTFKLLCALWFLSSKLQQNPQKNKQVVTNSILLLLGKSLVYFIFCKMLGWEPEVRKKWGFQDIIGLALASQDCVRLQSSQLFGWTPVVHFTSSDCQEPVLQSRLEIYSENTDQMKIALCSSESVFFSK